METVFVKTLKENRKPYVNLRKPTRNEVYEQRFKELFERINELTKSQNEIIESQTSMLETLSKSPSSKTNPVKKAEEKPAVTENKTTRKATDSPKE